MVNELVKQFDNIKKKGVIAMQIQRYNKAIVAVVVGVLLAGLSQLGIVGETSVEQALGIAVSGLMVWLVPNRG